MEGSFGALAKAYVEIGADQSPFDRALGTMKGKLASLASTRFNIPGGGFAAMLGGAGLGLGIGKAISGASDLSETLSKVGVVFDSSSSKVVAAADEMAKSFGIPKREFMDAAASFGLIATGMGQSKEEAADLSTQMAKLAVDASSFYNVPVADALEKIRAGMTGESEPLKAFGVIMDENTMKLEANRLGLGRNSKELTNQEKLVARVALIQKGLASATGDMARTQDGAANQTRKFWGALTNLGDSIGTTMLPAFTSFVGLINEVGGDLAKWVAASEGTFGGFFASIKGGIETAGVIYRNWGDIVERTGVMVGGNLQNMGEYFVHLGDTIKTFLDWFSTNFPKIIADTINVAGASFSNLSEMISDPSKAVAKVIAGGFAGKKMDIASLITDGSTITTPGFKAPAFKPSDNSAALAEIDARMAKREAEAGKGKVAEAAGGKGGPAGAAGLEAASKLKAGVIDFDAASKEFLEAGLKTGDIQGKMLDQAEKQTGLLDTIAKKVGAGAAMGAGVGAVARFG